MILLQLSLNKLGGEFQGCPFFLVPSPCLREGRQTKEGWSLGDKG